MVDKKKPENRWSSWEKCIHGKSCYELLRMFWEHALPVELLGPPCGGNNNRCAGQCAEMNEQLNSCSTQLSSSPNHTTKIINPPDPNELTFQHYLRFLVKATGTDEGNIPSILNDPSRPPHLWKKRYQIAKWKGIVCGVTYFGAVILLRWYLT